MKSKLLNLFLIVTMLSVWSWPELGLAVEIDWFGNKSKDQIIYLKGYNAAMSKLAATTLEIPTNSKTLPTKTTASQTSTITSSTNYVTNPMTADLDVNGFHFVNYIGGSVVFNTGLRTTNICVQANLTDPGACLGNEAILGRGANNGVSGEAMSDTGKGVFGQGFYGIAGNATRNNGAAVYGAVASGVANAYAGYFDGKVKMVNGGLVIDHGDLKVDSASGQNGVLSTVLVSGGTALRGVALAENSLAGAFVGNVSVDGNINVGPALPGKLTVLDENNNGIAFSAGANGANSKAGFFQTSGSGASALYAINSSSDGYAGFFDGRVRIESGDQVGLDIVADGTAITAWSERQTGGYGLFASGHSGVLGVANFPGGVGIYGQAYAGDYAGKFDGPVLQQFGNFVIGDGKLGIGTYSPNKQLHILATSTNAEINIQSGSNTHWGIYQDRASGNLNFWHGDNRVSFTDQGLSTNGVCLKGQCINSWKDLLKYIEIKPVVDPGVYPEVQP